MNNDNNNKTISKNMKKTIVILGAGFGGSTAQKNTRVLQRRQGRNQHCK